MSDANKPASVGRDALGVLLMAVAALSGVAVVMTMIRPVEGEPGGFTALYTGLVESLGPVAALFLSAGVFVIGVRLWIAGVSGRTGRDLIGVLLVTVALSILVGTLPGGFGGRFGDVFGGSVTRRLTVFVGLPFGLVCVLLPVWLFWLRTRVGAGNKSAGYESQSLAPSVRGPADATRGELRPFTAANDDRGAVSDDESEALLPRKPIPTPAAPPLPRVASTPPQPSPTTKAPAPTPIQPAVDVRVFGGVPEGAQPLAAPHARNPATPAAPRGNPARPAALQPEQSREPERDRELPRAPVAPAAELGVAPAAAAIVAEQPAEPEASVELSAPVRAAPPVLAEIDEFAAGIDIGDEREDEPTNELDNELDEAPAPVAEVAGDGGAVPFSSRPPLASWEQPGLFDEPVDAYGTPQELVEALRKSNAETTERLEEAPAPSDATPSLFAEPEPVAAPVSGALDDLEDEFEEDEELDDDAVDELDEPELDGEGDDDLEDEELADESPAAPMPLATAVTKPALEDVELKPQPKAAPKPSASVEPPAPAKAAPAAPAKPRPIEAEPRSEPRVVSESETDAPELDVAESGDLIYRAGLLFLDRGRVAVSMLQREFGLDFKAATAVLDQLQKSGLIGPYLGGQRRDILLTREEWAQRVGVS